MRLDGAHLVGLLGCAMLDAKLLNSSWWEQLPYDLVALLVGGLEEAVGGRGVAVARPKYERHAGWRRQPNLRVYVPRCLLLGSQLTCCLRALYTRPCQQGCLAYTFLLQEVLQVSCLSTIERSRSRCLRASLYAVISVLSTPPPCLCSCSAPDVPAAGNATGLSYLPLQLLQLQPQRCLLLRVLRPTATDVRSALAYSGAFLRRCARFVTVVHLSTILGLSLRWTRSGVACRMGLLLDTPPSGWPH